MVKKESNSLGKGGWIKKEIFEEGAQEAFYCKDPNIDKLLRDIIFLYRKLKNLQSKIEKEYRDFVKHIVEDCKKEAKKSLEGIKKDFTNEVKIKQVFESSSADNELFFNIDTFFIDLKRIIEFSFRLIARIEGLMDIKKFSLENLIDHLSNNNNNNNSKSKLVKTLMKKYPDYVKFILSNKNWFKSMNSKRTQSIHYKIFNKTGGFEIEYFLNSVMTSEDDPIINIPTIPLFDKPIPKLINEELVSLKQFMNKTLNLKKDLLQKCKIK